MLLSILSVRANCATFEEIRESGTLLLLFFLAVFGGFYFLCVLVLLLVGAKEKKKKAHENSEKIKLRIQSQRTRGPLGFTS